MKTNEVLDVMDEIAEEFYGDLLDDGKEHDNFFEFFSDGYNCKIIFLGITIYKDYDEEREWIEEINDYEPLVPYIKKKCNKIIDNLQGRRFKI
jgi:hypothetical protein